jgi:hypothetical protein
MQTFLVFGAVFGILGFFFSILNWWLFRKEILNIEKEYSLREKRLKSDFTRRIKDLTAHVDLIYTKKEDEIKQINS